ncbi:GNAT family N-acetyltransferase [Galbibacter sp. BG1]|uniref:GNAT family N-acetyltransferase n=1 Tax=Galbibacter sp. BG1 TaxID=1170699 RepID=UPI0015BF7793|nr:GNAT family N-acetyltransferase [Galbibacter sp. BG1]QLE01092.1 GNAT family N-acetyltransferase [Galbibacter sp. BG1]
MDLFNTARLAIRKLKEYDRSFFKELFTDERVINAVPQIRWSDEIIENKFQEHLNLNSTILANKSCYWGIYLINSAELIGLCMLLTNNENDRELGYRFRFEHWGRGYGKETALGMINFCFAELRLEKITADADINNVASTKILNKLMHPIKTFYNAKANCIDRRFELSRKDWESND